MTRLTILILSAFLHTSSWGGGFSSDLTLPINSGLVVGAHMREGTGTGMFNVAMASAPLTVTASWVDTPGMGTTIKLNGSSQAVLIPNPRAVTGFLTASAWVYPDIRFPTTNGRWQILSRDADSGLRAWQFAIGTAPNTDRKIDFILWNAAGSGPNYCQSDVSIPELSWSMVTVTYDGVNQKVYINGALRNTCPFSGTGVRNSGIQMYLGRNASGSYPGYFNGKICEAQLWNRALSAGEIQALYRNVRGNYAK